MSSNDVQNFLSDSSAYAAFTAEDEVGRKVEGYVASEPRLVQCWTYVSPANKAKGVQSKPDFWPARNGEEPQPKMQLIVDLETREKPLDEEDDGTRRLYVRFKLQDAFKAAMRKARLRGLEVGDYVTVTYTGRDTDLPENHREWALSPRLFNVVVSRENAAKKVQDAFLGGSSDNSSDNDGDPDELPSRAPRDNGRPSNSRVEDIGDDPDNDGADDRRTSPRRTQREPELTDEQRRRMRERGMDV